MSYPEVYHDLAVMLLPEALSTLRKTSAPQFLDLVSIENILPSLVSSADTRLGSSRIGIEQREFQEIFQYGITAYADAYLEGDWRPYLLFTELFNKMAIVEALQEWAINITTFTQNPVVVEANPAAPIMLAKMHARFRTTPYVIAEKWILQNTILKEAFDEYNRKYNLNLKALPLENPEQYTVLNSNVDVFISSSLEAMSLGWRTTLDLAVKLLKRRGTLIAMIPDNAREGLRSLLKIWKIPEYPPLDRLLRDLQAAKFTQTRYHAQGPFTIIQAQKR
jgi:hypothetical protein